jgi:hypothetical protein
MPMLTFEYKFVVYSDQGVYWVEPYREGSPFGETVSAETADDVGYEIARVLGEGEKIHDWE